MIDITNQNINIVLNQFGVSSGKPMPKVTIPANLVKEIPVPNKPPRSISSELISLEFKSILTLTSSYIPNDALIKKNKEIIL